MVQPVKSMKSPLCPTLPRYGTQASSFHAPTGIMDQFSKEFLSLWFLEFLIVVFGFTPPPPQTYIHFFFGILWAPTYPHCMKLQ